MLRGHLHHHEHHEEQREEGRDQEELEALEGVVDHAGGGECEPASRDHQERHRLPGDLAPGRGRHDGGRELGRLAGPAGPGHAEEADQREGPGPGADPVEPGHPAEHRLAGGEGPALDLHEHHELGQEPHPEQPPDGEAVRDHEVGPEQQLAGAESHPDGHHRGAEEVTEARHPGHLVPDPEGRAVAPVGEARRVGCHRELRLGEGAVDTVAELAALVVGAAEVVVRSGHRAWGGGGAQR